MDDLFSIAPDAPTESLDVSEATDTPASSGELVVNDDESSADTPAEENTVDSADLFDTSEDEFLALAKGETAGKTDAETAEDAAPESVTENTDDAVDVPEKETTDAVQSTDEDDTKLNWDSSPESFREAFKTQKAELNTLRENSLERSFLVDTPKFLEQLKEKSPSQYQDLVQTATNEAAIANPEGFIGFYVKENPDLVAQILFNDPKLTLQRVVAERETVEPALFDQWEDDDPAQTALDSPEKAEFDRLKQTDAERQKTELDTKRQSLLVETAAPITDAVNRIYRDASLEVSPTDTPVEKDFKEFINTVTPIYISQLLQTDESISPVFNKVNDFVEKLDAKGAKELQLSLVSYVEGKAEQIASFAGKLLMNNDQAKETPKSAVPPPKTPAAAAGVAGSITGDDQPVFSADFNMTDAEWAEIINRKK